jgi:hypothetical protein
VKKQNPAMRIMNTTATKQSLKRRQRKRYIKCVRAKEPGSRCQGMGRDEKRDCEQGPSVKQQQR